MVELTNLRNQIDEIDTEIMSLLDKRLHLAKQIGELKKVSNISVLDTNRENTILHKTSKYSHSPQIEYIYKTIMEQSKSIQRK